MQSEAGGRLLKKKEEKKELHFLSWQRCAALQNESEFIIQIKQLGQFYGVVQ